MSREFDSFIIVPELAEGPLKSKMHYFNAEKQEPEMVHLCIQGVVASWVHDATELEIKTIEFFERPDNLIRKILQAELAKEDEQLVLNKNVFLQIINVLAEQNGTFHRTKLTFNMENRKIDLYSYGLEF